MKMLTVLAAAFLALSGIAAAPAYSANVKVTPLGSHDGEFCRRDRAMLFEDPDGTRILFDPGMTIAGGADPRRLGKLDGVLLSSVHVDHIGGFALASVNAGTCGKPATKVRKMPVSNTAEIVAKTGSAMLAGGEMRGFLRAQVKAAGGNPKKVNVLRFGAEGKIGGVRVAIVPVNHSNGVNPGFLNKELAAALKKNGLTAYVGPDNGFILTFTNGLVVYMSGDSGIIPDQETTVRRFYKAKLAIINAGDLYTSGPKEARIFHQPTDQAQRGHTPQHMNEEATKGGKLIPGTKTAKFVSLVKGIPVHLPLSGRTMEFDANVKCVSGC
jgi:L-ascorbate metabolism protein UlaG (beta-lactamase superfamily)